MAAVRVPPSAWITSQSIWTVRSPKASKSVETLNHVVDRPVDGGDRLSWRQLSEYANRIAHFLKEKGVGANDRIAVLGENSLENLILYYGIQAYGATYCTVNIEINRGHLIEVLAFLHQHQLPTKTYQGISYIEANIKDYRWAYFLASRVLSQSMDELSRWARELLTWFEAQNPNWITRRELREGLHWPDRRTREASEELRLKPGDEVVCTVKSTDVMVEVPSR